MKLDVGHVKVHVLTCPFAHFFLYKMYGTSSYNIVKSYHRLNWGPQPFTNYFLYTVAEEQWIKFRNDPNNIMITVPYHHDGRCVHH